MPNKTTLVRPINLLYPLECPLTESPPDSSNEIIDKRTNTSNVLTRPKRKAAIQGEKKIAKQLTYDNTYISSSSLPWECRETYTRNTSLR